jgi:biotin carboxyl carrier protein
LLLADGRVFDYAADWGQARQQVIINHASQALVAVRQGAKQSGGSAAAGGVAVAPMSGQVSKILHPVGDKVESGQVVLVLEAMKMENEVVAPGAGVLKSLHVQVGENVAPGQKLFDIEALDP